MCWCVRVCPSLLSSMFSLPLVLLLNTVDHITGDCGAGGPAERAEWDTSSAAPCLSVTGMRGQQCYVVVTLKNVSTVNPLGWCAAFWYVPIADVVA